jgi:uncharacterized membrane protein YgcG
MNVVSMENFRFKSAEREKKEHSRTKPALNLISQVKEMIEGWHAQGMNRRTQVLTFAPSMHLVQRSFDELEEWAQEKGLYVCRHKLNDEEQAKFPNLPQKAARYFVKVATTQVGANMPPSAQEKQMAFAAPQNLVSKSSVPGNGSGSGSGNGSGNSSGNGSGNGSSSGNGSNNGGGAGGKKRKRPQDLEVEA